MSLPPGQAPAGPAGGGQSRPIVIPRESGVSSTPGLLGSIRGLWDTGTSACAGDDNRNWRLAPSTIFQKYRLTITQIRTIFRRSPCHQRDVSRSSRNVVRVAMDAAASGDHSPDENAGGVRRSRVVLAP